MTNSFLIRASSVRADSLDRNAVAASTAALLRKITKLDFRVGRIYPEWISFNVPQDPLLIPLSKRPNLEKTLFAISELVKFYKSAGMLGGKVYKSPPDDGIYMWSIKLNVSNSSRLVLKYSDNTFNLHAIYYP